MAKAPVQVVLRMIFTKGTWRTYLGIYLVSIRHVPCNVSCWIFVGGKPTSMDFLKQLQKSWNAVLRWFQECLHPECLHRSCGHFGAPWGARNDSRQVQGGDYMAVPRNLRTGRCLDGVHQLLVHALIRGASEGTLPNLLYNTWPESNGIYIYICVMRPWMSKGLQSEVISRCGRSFHAHSRRFTLRFAHPKLLRSEIRAKEPFPLLIQKPSFDFD